MSITTRDGLIAAMTSGQNIHYMKSGARTTVAGIWFSLFDLVGNPGAGTLAGSSTAAGVVPDDTTTGTMPINAYGGGNTGYLANVDFGSTVACRLSLYDMVFKAGAYAFNAAVSLSSQPSYAARMPNTDYTGTQIWLETVTAFTGNQTIAVTYTNAAGTAGQTTGTIATGVAPTVGRMLQLPLAAGDVGVQKIESVTSTIATVGTFNVLVLRELWSGRVTAINGGGNAGPDLTGLPIVPATAALYMLVAADNGVAGGNGTCDCRFNIVNG